MSPTEQQDINYLLFQDFVGEQNTAQRAVFEHMLAYETSKNTDTDMKMIQAYYNAVYGEVHSTASIIDRLNQITKKRGKVWIDTQEQRETLSVELDMEHTYTYAIEV